MPAKNQPPQKSASRIEHDDTPGVTALLAALDHPLKPVAEALRAVILGADPRITEGVKWNSASFYCFGWFATINLRPKGGVLVVLHQGAKKRDGSDIDRTIRDPEKLLQWPSADRAVIPFADPADVAGKRKSFEAMIRQWVEHQIRFADPTKA